MSTEEKTEKLFTARQIWAAKKIYWVTSYKALLKYISKDYVDIFKPITTGTRSGKRYYVKTSNIDAFIKKFENNQLN